MTPNEIPLGANQPFFLNRHDRVWQVASGEVEIFYAHIDAEFNFRSPRNFLYRAAKGDLLFSLQTEARTEGMTLMAVSANASLIEIKLEEIGEMASEALAGQIENWCIKLAASLYEGNFPRVYQPLNAGETITLTQKEVAYPVRGLAWLTLGEGEWTVYGDDTLEDTAKICQVPLPVSNTLWIKAKGEDQEVVVHATSHILQDDIALMHSLHHLQRYFFEKINRRYQAKAAESNRVIQQKLLADENTIKGSLKKLGSIVFNQSENSLLSQEHSSNHLLTACQMIGDEVGFAFSAPKYLDEHSQSTVNQLFAIGQISNVRIRKVILRGEWWKSENGHLLAFWGEDNTPVALIQDSKKGYLLKNPSTEEVHVISRELIEQLEPVAYMFFYSFGEPMSSLRKIWDFAIKGLKQDAVYIILAALSGSLIGLLVPILSGVLFDDVIPQADRGFLIEVFAIMVIIAVVTALLRLVQGVLQLRIETKSNINVQAGLMDHLLRLPVTFYRQFSSGDLTLRALGINSIRQILSSTVLTAVLSGAFSFVNLGLLFYYDSSLAWVGIGLSLFAVAVISGIGMLKLRHDRQIADVQGDIQGYLFEFLSGITKIRITGAEKRIFSMWATRFAKLKGLGFKSGSHQNFVEVFNASYPLLTRIFFFGALYYWMQTAGPLERGMISVGAFMAFVSAFSQFLNDCLNLSMAAIGSMNLIPLYERVQPILEAVPESTEDSADPGEILGEIELNSVNFRYEEGQPLVLKDVSLKIKPGEMVAFVGPSGSGKSTIMRILLGFEEPEGGSVYYDGQAYDSLNKDLVRRQIGVVLQNGSLMAGSIYKNIVGNSELSLENAWEAARMAGLEEDIKQMPMEMHTMVSEGAGTFSGGQRQRLMIARAIVHKPRMLFMDEATSALDNRTQNIVSESLDRLQATRIVIAHRLSTVVNADRIFVMEDGEIVESGTYEELIANEGLFSKLAKRQIA